MSPTPLIHREESSERASVAPRWAVIGIFLIMCIYFVAEARDFLMPVTLAVLLFFVFVPVRRFLVKLGLNNALSAALITLGMILVIVVLGIAASGPFSNLAGKAPQLAETVQDRIEDLRANFRGVLNAAAQLEQMSEATVTVEAGAERSPIESMPDEANVPGVAAEKADISVSVEAGGGSGPVGALLNIGPAVLGQVGLSLLLLFFMLASGDLMYLKIVQSFDSLSQKRQAYVALREIESVLGSYLGTITLINAVLGICIGAAMWAWDMPSPLLFGLFAFILNFIPYLGAIMGVAAASVIALVVTADPGTSLLIGGTYLTLTSIEGQLVTPYFVSLRLSLNTVVVVLTVALWAWLWSVIGMVAAVPVLVVLRVISQHIPKMQKFGNFLGGEIPPKLEDREMEEARNVVEPGEKQDSAEDAADLLHVQQLPDEGGRAFD